MKKTKKLHKRIFKIADSVYESRLWVIANCSAGDAADWYYKRYKKHLEYSEDADGFHARCTTKKYGTEHLIWIEKWDWEHQEVAVLGHEVLHFAFSVLGGVGMSLSPESEEAYTYFFQKTFQDCLYKIGPTNYEKLRNRIKREVAKEKEEKKAKGEGTHKYKITFIKEKKSKKKLKKDKK